MKYIFLGIIVLLVFISGCTINPIIKNTLENYNSLSSYKTTEITELKSKHYEKVHTIPKTDPNYDPDKELKILKQEIRKRTTEIIFKKPNNLKLIKTDEIVYIKDKVEWKYNPEKNTLCKGASKQIFRGNYFKDLITAFNYNYKIENLGEEEINGQLCYIIKLIPKRERGYDGSKLYTNILWISKDNNLFVKIESYGDDGGWIKRTEYVNTQINIEISDKEFELPESAEVLPISNKYFNIENAQKEFNNKIKLPIYLPEGFELSFVEIKKLCAGNEYAELNYEKEDKNILTISEIKTDERKQIIRMVDDGMIKCYGEGEIDILIQSDDLDYKEIEKIGEGFGCWTTGGVTGSAP